MIAWIVEKNLVMVFGGRIFLPIVVNLDELVLKCIMVFHMELERQNIELKNILEMSKRLF